MTARPAAAPDGRRAQRRGDVGALTPFALLLCTSLVALLALVADGGRALAAREGALTEAQQAARVGAEQLSVAAIHDGSTAFATTSAIAAAEYLMAADGHLGTARVVHGQVQVTVSSYPLQTPLLALVGIDHIPVTASAEASPEVG